MKPIAETLLRIDKEFTRDELVIIFEQVINKLNPKTISNYARDNKMSYNGVKNHREYIKVDSVKFIIDDITNANLPF